MTTNYEFINMIGLIGQSDKTYRAGEQLILMRDNLPRGYTTIVEFMQDDWSGEWAIVWQDGQGRVIYVDGYFGSCSGCDILCGLTARAYFTELNLQGRRFDNINALSYYIKTTNSYSIAAIKANLLEALAPYMDVA